jgi:hypothetical protein
VPVINIQGYVYVITGVLCLIALQTPADQQAEPEPA